MRRLFSAFLATGALLLALAGPVAAAPSSSANCVAQFVNSFPRGTVGQEASAFAQEAGGLGHEVGGQGAGEAPTNCGQR